MFCQDGLGTNTQKSHHNAGWRFQDKQRATATSSSAAAAGASSSSGLPSSAPAATVALGAVPQGSAGKSIYSGSSSSSGTRERALPGTASNEAAVEAAWAQKHRLARLRKERQQQLRQQQMQYDAASTTGASQAAEIAEGHEQQAPPPPPIARQPRRGVAPSQKEDEMHEAEGGRVDRGEDEDGGDEGTVAAEYYKAYLLRSADIQV